MHFFPIDLTRSITTALSFSEFMECVFVTGVPGDSFLASLLPVICAVLCRGCMVHISPLVAWYGLLAPFAIFTIGMFYSLVSLKRDLPLSP